MVNSPKTAWFVVFVWFVFGDAVVWFSKCEDDSVSSRRCFEATDATDPAHALLCDKAEFVNQAGRDKQ